MFHYDNFSGAIIFGLTIVIGAAGSFIILKLVSKASADLRKRSLFFDRLFKVVIITMMVMVATFIAMFLGFYYYNTSVRYLAYFVFSLSTIVSVGIMIIIGFKFFSWYKVSAYKVSTNGKSNHLLLMFGVAFLVVARKVESGKIKDYFTIAAIGAMMMSITLAPSASQQTFGVAGRSLMLLASFMLCAGFYLSAFQMAQDANLRRLTKTSAGSKVFGEMGSAQFGQEIEKKVLNVLDKEEDHLAKEHTDIQPSSEQEDVKSYLDNVLNEVEQNKWKTQVNGSNQLRDFRDI